MTPAPRSPVDAISFAALLPHAPILIPAVAGARAAQCAATTAAMRMVARRLAAAAPAAVILVSPHAPRPAGAYGLSAGPVAGGLRQFGHARLAVSFPGDAALTNAIAAAAREAGVATWVGRVAELDHGSVVPLWFVAEAGWAGPVVVVALPDEEQQREPMGRAIAQAAVRQGRRVAVIASGDMSHRLRDDGPMGFHPDGAVLDAEVMRRLRIEGEAALAAVDAGMREHAAEDVVESTAVVLAACGDPAPGRAVLSYEGPFGVGYGVALLRASAGEEEMPRVARRSLAAAFGEGGDVAPMAGLPSGAGVFVTLRRRDGELRGCIGTLAPRQPDLGAETWRVARDAAFHDRRFSPVRREELAELEVEVTVLQPPEPVASEAELDPARWGVVVSAADGRRGVLLPGIPEVTTPAQQIEICRRKAGIDPGEPVALQRFGARHYGEAPP